MSATSRVIPSAARDLQLANATNCRSLLAALLGTTGRAAPLVAALVLLSLASPLTAQEPAAILTPAQAREAETAMSRLRSPVTPAHTVDMCPSTAALRDTIRMAAATGATASELVEDVIARHGEHLRVLPKQSGAGLIAWLATPLLLLVGGGLIFARLRRHGAGAAPGSAPGATREITDVERERLEAAMRRFEDTGGLEP